MQVRYFFDISIVIICQKWTPLLSKKIPLNWYISDCPSGYTFSFFDSFLSESHTSRRLLHLAQKNNKNSKKSGAGRGGRPGGGAGGGGAPRGERGGGGGAGGAR